MELILLIVILITIVTAIYLNYLAWSANKPKPLAIVNPFNQPSVFCVFPCKNCNDMLTVNDHIMPGEVTVMSCPNCSTSWTIYAPQLSIKQTKDLSEPLKGIVAQKLLELNART